MAPRSRPRLAHSLHLDHDIGVGDWFTTLATRPRPGTLTAWWSPTRCARLWGDLARPDGYGRLDPPDTAPPPGPGQGLESRHWAVTDELSV
ncbi:replication-relaxation family protein [Nocardia australiensis]|uniref:replication-relaxation family protein n=1 Tax=Nocardia australiensis TaxID=2887191 RepID=UPI001D14C0B4